MPGMTPTRNQCSRSNVVCKIDLSHDGRREVIANDDIRSALHVCGFYGVDARRRDVLDAAGAASLAQGRDCVLGVVQYPSQDVAD